MPPVPVVVAKIEVQVVPSGDVWTWNDLAYAASHCSTTWVIEAVEPRSTRSHCGSEKALDQRVLAFPSTALDAGYEALSVDDAVAGLPCDSSVAAFARSAGPATEIKVAAKATTTATIQAHRHADDRRKPMTTEPMANPYPPGDRLDIRLIS